MKCEEIEINGIKYVPKEQKAETLDGMKYCIIRTYSAGVFAGFIEKRIEKETVIRQARRLWYWDGAASLSQLAVDGVKKPQNCKFPVAVGTLTVTETIEIIECTDTAKKSIEGVPIWKH